MHRSYNCETEPASRRSASRRRRCAGLLSTILWILSGKGSNAMHYCGLTCEKHMFCCGWPGLVGK